MLLLGDGGVGLGYVCVVFDGYFVLVVGYLVEVKWVLCLVVYGV